MDLKNIETISAQRATIYKTLIGVFMHLPDDGFLDYINSTGFMRFFESLRKLRHPVITKGADLIAGFLQGSKDAETRGLAERLAVDRTRLIRMPHNISLRAPYESQYHKEMKTSSSLKRLTTAYINAGFIPADAKESPDFFCGELDFMRVLSERISKEPAKAGSLLVLQKDFLNEHLGKWIGAYINDASPYAETDFYRGCLMILQGFIEVEKDYLQNL